MLLLLRLAVNWVSGPGGGVTRVRLNRKTPAHPQFSLTADETSHVAPAVSLSVPSQQLPVVYTTTTATTDDLEEFTEPVYDQVLQELITAGEMTENIVEIPVVTEYYPMTDDEGGELSAGVRPAPLEEGRPHGKLQRHAGIGYELVQALDALVLQMVEQLPDVSPFLRHVSAGCCRAGYRRAQDHPREHPYATLVSRHATGGTAGGSADDRILFLIAADYGAQRRHSSSWWWWASWT